MNDAAARFDEIAAGYAETMAPSLRAIAGEVVRRAAVQPGERVLDVGTGTGTAAAMAADAGGQAIGIDAAPRMIDIARRERPDLDVRVMDFAALDLEDGSVDVVLAVHALLFADDQVGALREWRRVTRPGGRLSLSVPGPSHRSPAAHYREVYRRFGIDAGGRYPDPATLATTAASAGWTDIRVDADASTAIVLPDERAFRVWREIGFRNPAADGLTAAQQRALTDAMLAITPADADGALRIPFGALYLVAAS